MTNQAQKIDSLSTSECWKQLATAAYGRLATGTIDPVTQEVLLEVFPVNFLVREGAILFRSGPGSKMMELTANPTVAFQADGRRWRTRWSVVAHGTARRLGVDEEIEQSGLLELATAHRSDKWNYVRIDVTSITGMRFRGR